MKSTVVITGGTKGLGRATALAFARAGHFVVALYSTDQESALQFESALAAGGGAGCAWQHDVCVENASLWERPQIQEAQRLILIHNACASFTPQPLHQLRWDQFEHSLAVAVKGCYLCSQGLIRHMIKKGNGVIAAILTAALEGPPPKGFAAYLTSKHALRGLIMAMAAEYRSRGVRIFSASPGFMDTPLTEQWDARLREAIRAASPRVSHIEQAAARLLELACDERIEGQGEDYPI
jgi:NAD(P)-dependent dehydrogenase (short-subunit alcohol dehydrogenase family)